MAMPTRDVNRKMDVPCSTLHLGRFIYIRRNTIRYVSNASRLCVENILALDVANLERAYSDGARYIEGEDSATKVLYYLPLVEVIYNSKCLNNGLHDKSTPLPDNKQKPDLTSPIQTKQMDTLMRALQQWLPLLPLLIKMIQSVIQPTE